MALQPSTHPRAHASHASHASHSHAAHAASKAKPSLSAEEGEGGGFAAQLLKAQPAAGKDPKDPKDAKAVDAKPKAEAAKKPSEDKDGKDGADAKDASQDDKDAKTPEAKPPVVDPAALLAAQQPIAPPTTSLADRTAIADHDDFATDPLGALRKAAAKPGKDDGKAALLAGLGAGTPAPATATATAAGVPGKGAAATGDIAAALAKAEGAVKAATEARDALAAMLPQPDPVAVQAGAVGAPANAPLDANQATQQAAPTPPAQATLAMPPQSPTFGPALGHQIDVWMKGGVQHAEVQLSPQDLGPIRVKIEMDGAQARVQMSADVQSTRDALQQAMPQLSQQLGQVGLSLSGGGVSDQPTFQQSQAQAQAHAGGSGQGGRPGHGGSSGSGGGGGLEDIAAASAARQAAQRRGLLDTYA
jgi:flagellar hook-length control protein FliK